MKREPKPLRVGCTTDGPPFSAHVIWTLSTIVSLMMVQVIVAFPTDVIPRIEALTRQQFAAAIKGNVRAVDNILKMLRQYDIDTADPPEPLDLQDLSMEELVMLKNIKTKSETRAFHRDVVDLTKKRGLKDEAPVETCCETQLK